MSNQSPISYNIRVPRELKMFIEMIVDVYNGFEDVKWSTKSHEEIGFYYRDKQKKTEYFFGVWYDLWEDSGIPLSLTLTCDTPAPMEWHRKLVRYIEENYKDGIVIKHF